MDGPAVLDQRAGLVHSGAVYVLAVWAVWAIVNWLAGLVEMVEMVGPIAD